MIKKIRIGKDFKVIWSLLVNDKPLTADLDITVFQVDPYKNVSEIPAVIEDGKLVFSIFGVDQKYVGIYRLEAWLNYGKINQSVLDKCQAFRLVDCTCKEDPNVYPYFDNPVLELDGNIQMGISGASAYEIWLRAGNEGSEGDFLDSLKGEKGDQGFSAYELAVQEGYEGTLEEWIESLKGEKGDQGEAGEDGKDGLSAYEIAVEKGYEGSEEDWLKSLKGDQGEKGDQGYSAYEIAVQKGFPGSEEEWLVYISSNIPAVEIPVNAPDDIALVTLTPNVYTKVTGPWTGLEFALMPGTDPEVYVEYRVQFNTKDPSFGYLVLPSGVKISEEIQLDPDCVYELSIVDNLAVCLKWEE